MFRAFHTANDVILEIEDDGRGIDWAAVASHAQARGLPCQSEADLMRALVIGGLSTRQAVTQSSGRGVGMSAVHHEVESLGGELTVQSQLARGTCWRVRVPLRLRLRKSSRSAAATPFCPADLERSGAPAPERLGTGACATWAVRRWISLPHPRRPSWRTSRPGPLPPRRPSSRARLSARTPPLVERAPDQPTQRRAPAPASLCIRRGRAPAACGMT